jgi:hypothetical protein
MILDVNGDIMFWVAVINTVMETVDNVVLSAVGGVDDMSTSTLSHSLSVTIDNDLTATFRIWAWDNK